MIKLLKYFAWKTLALFAGVFFFLFETAKSQNVVLDNDNVMRRFNLTDVTGKTFVNPNIDVAGSQFLFEKWETGILKINEKSIFTNLLLRIDLLNQEVHFLKENKIELVIQAGTVAQVTLIDSSGTNVIFNIYRCGYPAIDNQNEKNFYQVLCDGKIGFLKSKRKTIYQNKDALSGELKKEFREYEDYYFFMDKKMYRIKKDKKFILDFMKANEAKIETYINDNKLSCKSTDDIKKIVDYYNSL